MIVPRALWNLPIKPLRAAAEGYHEFGRYMSDLVEREKGLGNGKDRHNLLSNLVRHSSEQGNERVLTDEEIIGNTFIFLIAGHESTYALSQTC
jgi:cytochrome P450